MALFHYFSKNMFLTKQLNLEEGKKNNNNEKKKKECKIENVNNFSLHLKIEIIIFIISHQMYYTDFNYISSNVLY